MKKNIVRIVIVCITMTLFCFMNTVFANSIAGDIQNKGKTILNAIVWLGYALALGMIVFIGIKYMLGSAGTKANMKGAITKWIIGAIIVFIPTTIINMTIATTGSNTSSKAMENAIQNTLSEITPMNRIEDDTGKDENTNQEETSGRTTIGGRNRVENQKKDPDRKKEDEEKEPEYETKLPRNETEDEDLEQQYDSTENEDEENIPVKKIRLSKNSLELEKDKEVVLSVTINPSNATNKKVTWSSSDHEIISIKTEER